MCEIFGVCLKDQAEINRYLKLFYRHANEHPNGWGLAVMNGSEVNIEKEPENALKSDYLHYRLQESLVVKSAFAHIRYATIGHVEYSNCHPFSEKDAWGNTWTLVHNGTVFDCPDLDRYFYVQRGSTDSERILLGMVDRINHLGETMGREPKPEERFAELDQWIGNLAEGNKINLMFSDGTYYYAHCNYPHTLHCLRRREGLYFSTLPLTKEPWEEVPFTRLLVYREGNKVYEGKSHGHVYQDTEENTRYLFLPYAEL